MRADVRIVFFQGIPHEHTQTTSMTPFTKTLLKFCQFSTVLQEVAKKFPAHFRSCTSIFQLRAQSQRIRSSNWASKLFWINDIKNCWLCLLPPSSCDVKPGCYHYRSWQRKVQDLKHSVSDLCDVFRELRSPWPVSLQWRILSTTSIQMREKSTSDTGSSVNVSFFMLLFI